MNPKFKINQELFHLGCTKDYQLKNIFIPKYIQENTREWTDDDDIKRTTLYIAYSDNGYSWYPEGLLTTKLNEV